MFMTIKEFKINNKMSDEIWNHKCEKFNNQFISTLEQCEKYFKIINVSVNTHIYKSGSAKSIIKFDIDWNSFKNLKIDEIYTILNDIKYQHCHNWNKINLRIHEIRDNDDHSNPHVNITYKCYIYNLDENDLKEIFKLNI